MEKPEIVLGDTEFAVRIRRDGKEDVVINDDAMEINFAYMGLLKETGQDGGDQWIKFANLLNKRWESQLDGLTVTPAFAATKVYALVVKLVGSIKKNTDGSAN